MPVSSFSSVPQLDSFVYLTQIIWISTAWLFSQQFLTHYVLCLAKEVFHLRHFMGVFFAMLIVDLVSNYVTTFSLLDKLLNSMLAQCLKVLALNVCIMVAAEAGSLSSDALSRYLVAILSVSASLLISARMMSQR
jgi:hypothetical protein